MFSRTVFYKNVKIGRVLVLALSLSTSSIVFAASNIEARVEQLERTMAARQEYDLLGRIEQLQDAVSQLQGQVELQGNKIRQLTEAQKNFDKIINENQPASPTEVSTDTENSDTLSDEVAAQNGIAGPSAGAPVQLTEQGNYSQAQTLLSQKNYPDAILALQAYVKEYPQGSYAASAWYWLGEVYLIQGNNSQALSAFKLVVDQFPEDPKAADSLLKLGYVYAALGNKQKARDTFKLVIQRYPETSTAKIAETRLQAL